MASLAELMFSSASQNIRDTKSDPSAIAKAYASGAQLAQAKEQLGLKKQQNEQAMKQAKLKGIEQVLNVYKGADKFKSEAQGNAFLKGVPNVVEAYGVGDVFTPEVQQLMQTSSEARQAAFHIEAQVRQGKMTADEGQQFLTLANIPQAIEMKRLADAEQFALSETNKSARSKDQITAAQVRQDTGIQAKIDEKATDLANLPQKKVKEKAGTMYAEYQLLGKGGVQKKLDGLRSVLKDLQSGELETRTKGTLAIGAIPFGDPMNKLSLVNPKLRAAVDRVRGAVSLKGALDSQFSKAEADQVYSRAFDINATPEQNIIKITAMIDELENNERNAMQLYQEQGLMPKDPKQVKATDQAPEEINIPEERVVQLRDVYTKLLSSGKSPEEVFNMLKMGVGGTDAQINQLIKKFQIEGQ